jgi:hypothetical protein
MKRDPLNVIRDPSKRPTAMVAVHRSRVTDHDE